MSQDDAEKRRLLQLALKKTLQARNNPPYLILVVEVLEHERSVRAPESHELMLGVVEGFVSGRLLRFRKVLYTEGFTRGNPIVSPRTMLITLQRVTEVQEFFVAGKKVSVDAHDPAE